MEKNCTWRNILHFGSQAPVFAEHDRGAVKASTNQRTAPLAIMQTKVEFFAALKYRQSLCVTRKYALCIRAVLIDSLRQVQLEQAKEKVNRFL
jgi:hypothetical protein